MYKKLKLLLTINRSYLLKMALYPVITGVAFVLSLSMIANSAASAATRDTINFQGKIVQNTSGNEGLNVTTGSTACILAGPSNDTCDFRARFYDAAVGGNLLATEEFLNAEIGEYDGIFNLALGDGSFTAGTEATFAEIFINNTDVYVEIGFAPGGAQIYGELFTRMAVRAAPFAISANDIGGFTPDDFVKFRPSSVQTDTTTLASIFINKTGASGNILQLQKNGTDVLVLDNAGNFGLGPAIPVTKLHISGDGGILATGTYGSGTGWDGGSLNGGERLMWIPEKAAFRAGRVSGTQWNAGLIGNYSTAFGRNTLASGNNSTAFGYFTQALGDYSMVWGQDSLASGILSTAWGDMTVASGIYSTAWGLGTEANSFSSTSIGRYNVGGGTAGSWVATDSLFEVGIGTSNAARANAFTILKNGNVGIGNAAPSYTLDVTGNVRITGYMGLFGAAPSSSIAINTGTLGNNQTALSTNVTPTGSGIYAYGVQNILTSGGNATNPVGISNISSAPTSASGNMWGIRNVMSNGGSGWVIGNYNNLTATTAGHIRGNWNVLSGTAYMVGEQTDITTTGTSGITGIGNYINLINTNTNSGTELYGFYVVDGNSSSAATTYGLYVDLDDPDTTNYSIWVEPSSGTSYFGSNVGIGAVTPGYLLDVSGGSGIVGRFSGRVIGGNAVNSDEFVTLGQVSASLLPSGATGQTLRYNGSAWVANSLLYNNGTNIGINTSSPTERLSVMGNATLGDNTIANGTNNYLSIWGYHTSAAAPKEARFVMNSSGRLIVTGDYEQLELGEGGGTGRNLVFRRAANNAVMGIDSFGDLQYSGSFGAVKFANNLRVNSDNYLGLGNSSSGFYRIMYDSANSNSLRFTYNGATNEAGRLTETGSWNFLSNALFINSANSRVGVGIATPGYLFDVSGGTGIVGQFSGRVIGGNAVNSNEFVTKSQLDAVAAANPTLAQVLTAGNLSGGTAIDMQNALITNIGNAGTDFTSGGGLTLAGNFQSSALSAFGTATPNANILASFGLTVSDLSNYVTSANMTRTGTNTANRTNIGSSVSISSSAAKGLFTDDLRGSYSLLTISGVTSYGYADYGLIQVTGSGIVDQSIGSFGGVTTATTATSNSSFGGYNFVSNGSSAAMTSARGTYSLAESTSSGGITTAYGSFARVTNSGAGTIGNAYGFYTDIQQSSGTITNAFGVYIAAIGGTNKWGVYQTDATANNYFGGNVGIGIAAPTALLHVEKNQNAATISRLSNSSNTVNALSSSIVVSGANSLSLTSYAPTNSSINGNKNMLLSIGTELNLMTSGPGAYPIRFGHSFMSNSYYMSILTNGNVGIGTDAPGNRVDVRDSLAVGSNAIFTVTNSSVLRHVTYSSGAATWNLNSGSGEVGSVLFTTPVGNPAIYIMGTNTNNRGNVKLSGSTLMLGASSIGGNPADTVQILSTGNVGIGTNPGVRFHVAAAALYSGPTLGTASGGLGLTGTGNYGLWAGVSGSGDTWLQSQRSDGLTNAYNILLNPAGGNVGIGVTPTNTLDVNGTVRVRTFGGATANTVCRDANGVLSTCSSSIRYKNNVQNLGLGLNEVMALRPVTYNWKSDGSYDLGFIAEEVYGVNPLLTFGYGPNQVEGVKYERLTALLVKAIQQQQAQIDALSGDTSYWTLGSSTLSTTYGVKGANFSNQNNSFVVSALGNVTTSGNVQIGGVLRGSGGILNVDGTLNADTLIAKQFAVDRGDVASASAGVGTITAGQLEAEIVTSSVLDGSLVFVTAYSTASGVPNVGVKIVENGKFTVQLDQANAEDVKFTWWVVR